MTEPIDFEALDRALDDPSRVDAARRTLNRPLPAGVELVTRELADRVGVPYAAVTVLDDRHQHVLAATDGPDECSRDSSHCQYVVGTGKLLAINNTEADSMWRRLARNLICGAPLQAYLGVPLQSEQQPIGAVCVVDVKPREWTAEDHLAVTRASQRVAKLLSP